MSFMILSKLYSIKQYVNKVPSITHAWSSINRLSNIYSRKKNVAMLHTGRCGSTVLGRMLNSHSKIIWAGEIFEKFMKLDQVETTNEFMSNTINTSRDGAKSEIYGFETKYLPQQHLSYKCLNMSIDDYITSLHNMGFSHYIVLHRKNYLRRAISAQVGRESGQWHTNDKTASPRKVYIDINSYKTGVRHDSLIDLFTCMDESYNYLKQSLPGRSLFLTYEDDIQDDPHKAYEKVCEFLDVKNESPEITLYRTNPFSYIEMVSNFEEIESILKNTKYSWMLDN